MRKLSTAIFLLAALSTAVFAQSDHQMNMAPAEKPAQLIKGLGSLHHAVSTKNPEAQRFFDQGLSLVFAFNHDEAVRSFKRAAELDNQLAMAHWGIALALGPNINVDVDPDHEKAAYEAAQKALALSATAPANERAYIEALAKRYSLDPKADLKQLAVAYKNAMGEVVKRYPDDLDAATLYAESAMDLKPWQLWTSDGKPAEGTLEIVAVLESVLHRNPNHPGAIHYYIHTIEASPHPERALPYAPRLPQLMPAAGHLVHMPAHIYERTGDYAAAAKSNVDAAAADEAYFKAIGQQGIYSMLYAHNLDFLAVAASMEGRYGAAIEASNKLIEFTRPVVKEMPMFEPVLATSMLMQVRFQKWDELLKEPAPEASYPATNAIWHMARGLSFAARNQLDSAAAEQQEFLKLEKSIPDEAMFGLNSTKKILAIAEDVLAARLAEAKHDNAAARELLNKAIADEDALSYDEPPAWFQSTREMLGGFLLRTRNFVEAEKVFRADLERNKRSGRSLFGVAESLKGQGKKSEAARAQREFENSWKRADTKLSVFSL